MLDKQYVIVLTLLNNEVKSLNVIYHLNNFFPPNQSIGLASDLKVPASVDSQ